MFRSALPLHHDARALRGINIAHFPPSFEPRSLSTHTTATMFKKEYASHYTHYAANTT